MGRSSIEWTDETWNPTRGCEVCSPGCANCYAMRMAGRFSGVGGAYNGLVTITKNGRSVWNGEVTFDAKALAKPLTWRKPRRVFVNSMSDLFYEGFTFEQIAAVYGVMVATPHITYQVLTKRATRRNEFQRRLARDAAADGMSRAAFCFSIAQARGVGDQPRGVVDAARGAAWPPSNVWEGVSVENQAVADERVSELLVSEASVRFLSCEPLLEEVSLWAFLKGDIRDRSLQALGVKRQMPGIDWVIAGCESGPKRRPCDDAWLRAIRDQCKAAGTAFFLKQAYRNGVLESLPELDGVQHAEFPPP